MPEERMKIKELAAELGLQPKEVLQAVREFGMAAKSTAGSVSLEEAERLRRHLAPEQYPENQAPAQPDVIVRRRRKEAAPPADAPATEARERAPKDAAPEEIPPVKATHADDGDTATKDAALPAAAEPEDNAAKPAPPARETPESKKTDKPVKARVISRPGQKENTAEPVIDKEAPEKSGLTMADLIPETPKTSRLARPDASAEPEGSSAPTLPEDNLKIQKDLAAQEEAGPSSIAPKEKAVAPQVRVISRPQAAEARPSSPRPARPAGSRPPRPAAASPKPGTFAQPAGEQTADTRDGQSKKKRLKGRRTVDFQQGEFDRHQEDEGIPRMNRRGRNKPGKKEAVQAPPQPTQPLKAAKRKIRISEAISVGDMARQMGLKANEVIKILFGFGVMATINQALDIDTATLVASEFGYEVEKTGFSEEEYLLPKTPDTPENLQPRPPVVTIMGHVDHGKTSLLDAIRKSHVTSGEAGGITQHIGAYHVKTKRGEITFLDTPGHEAFTAMRARGAQVTDLVILVVAADDGVMEQTREAINHSRAADVPIMVAVNKMDKPGADPDRVLRELAELGLQPEDWGGDTIVARVSAKTREGLDDLLEMVALQSEIMELKANPDKPARGHIVEARLDRGRGSVATVLIQEGTLHYGDNFVCGPFAGRVRALVNDQGKKAKDAGPSIPVEVQGFDGVPEAGEEFAVVADDKVARRIADARAAKLREKALASESRVTLETFLSQQASDTEVKTLNLVLKSDVQGSLEAITESLNKLNSDKVRLNIVHGGTGAISESDIMLASASRAIIIGFNVRPTARIKDVAERENVDIRFYDIIYKLVEDIQSAMAGLLAPVQKEVYLGQAEVRDTFNVPKVGVIAGCFVADGKIARNAGVRLLRDGVVVYTGRISSLKRFKDDAREVLKGMECGAGLENFNDVKVGDVLEAFETVEEAATL